MKYLKNIILLFVFLNSFYGFAQCETVKSLFENDLYASKELRDYASKADDPDKVFDAWHLLLEEKSLEKTNAKVLKEVEDNYEAIKNAGGYVKWKNVNQEGDLSSKLVSRGISSAIADDIALRVMYIDDVIGTNKMQSMIDELVSSSKFKNPEDLADNLKSVFSGNSVSKSNAENLLKEFEEGKYWVNQGKEVYVSKKWSANADEVDVTITTEGALVECKNVSGDNFKAVESNLTSIVQKYTVESKLSTSLKKQYPNHYGKLSISSANNPFYNSTKADFISKIKYGDVTKGQLSIIGDGSNQIPLENLKKVKELHVENAQGRFIIKNTDW